MIDLLLDRLFPAAMAVLVFLIVGTLIGCLVWMFVYIWGLIL